MMAIDVQLILLWVLFYFILCFTAGMPFLGMLILGNVYLVVIILILKFGGVGKI